MPSAGRLLLVTVAVVAALAHVCEASPVLIAGTPPARAAVASGHGHDGEHGGHGHGAGDFHAASCEVAKTATVSLAAPDAGPVSGVPSLRGPVDRRRPPASSLPAIIGPSPPLFLRHAALLI